MKKIIYLLSAVTCLISGCSQIEMKEVDNSDCVVSFNLIGEITSSEEPMSKSASDDIYIIQVYHGQEPFALGIVDDISSVRINLKKSNYYRIVVSVIKNGKQTNSYYTNTNSNTNGFWVDVRYSYYSSNKLQLYQTRHKPVILNNMYYAYNLYYDRSSLYADGSGDWGNSTPYYVSIVTENTQLELDNKYPTCDDWLYGEGVCNANGSFCTVPINMKRIGFKLKYELSGVTDGEVTVKVYNSDKTFINNTTNTSTYSGNPVFFAFYDAYSAWQYADDYMENFTLSVSWLRGIGITEDYGTKTIQLKRNCLNNIKINLGSNDQSAGMNLTVEAENTIGSESVTIPVQ